MKSPKLVSKKIVFKGNMNVYLARVMLPNKKVFNENFMEWRGDTSVIVAIDNKNNIYLSKEWRPAWEREITAIPGGIVKRGKSSYWQARREMREEIGMDARNLKELVTVLAGMKIKHKVHIYLATDLFESPLKSDENEIIDVVKMPFREACRMFLSGKEQTTSYTIIGLLLAKEKLKL